MVWRLNSTTSSCPPFYATTPINHQGTYRLRDQNTWRPLTKLVTHPGQSWSGRVVCFKTRPLSCSLLARWEPNYKDPWLVVTDLDPKQADILWYGLRSSTECVYRDLKSDGWQWHRTRLLDPQRAERLWLVLAVASLWMIILGGHLEHCDSQTSPQHQSGRSVSCFLLGSIAVIANLLNNLPIRLSPWRHFPHTPMDSFFAHNSS